MKKKLLLVTVVALVVIGFSGCAGLGRGWTSFWASSLGADWIVTQVAADGTPFMAWKLEDVSVTNERASDGIYWKNEAGHLVHIGGWYNRVQVEGKRFDEAAKLLGVKLEKIQNGRYAE